MYVTAYNRVRASIKIEKSFDLFRPRSDYAEQITKPSYIIIIIICIIINPRCLGSLKTLRLFRDQYNAHDYIKRLNK